MFFTARIKITVWYVGIIVGISAIFSWAIYRVSSQELDRFSQMQRFRIERRMLVPVQGIDEELLHEAKRRLIWSLVFINLGIVAIGGGLGYMLSGETLKPIQEMVDEQLRFISDASHTFRTPLTALKTNIEVNLRDARLTVRQARRLLEESLWDVDRLQVLSDTMLQLTQYPLPKSKTNFVKTNISQVTTNALEKLYPLAKNKKVMFYKDIQENLIVWADKTALYDLVIILVDNAIKYSPYKSIVSIGLKESRNTVWLKISDQGPGIKDSDKAYIFDRYFRSDSTRISGVEGYGLGLAMAKRIVASHKGKIMVQSELGEGATFVVGLPAVKGGDDSGRK